VLLNLLVFVLEFSPKIKTKSDGTVLRDAKDFQITMSRGDSGKPYDANKIVNNSTLFVNRENSNIGRVIVIGDRVRVNTMFSTLGNEKNTVNVPELSSNKSTFSLVALPNIRDFDDFPAMYVKETTNENGVAGVIMNFSNLNFISNHADDFFPQQIPIDSATLNNETSRLIFDYFEVPEVEAEIKGSFDEDHQVKKDLGLFVADEIIEPDDDNGETGFDWMFVRPVKSSEVVAYAFSEGEEGGHAHLNLFPVNEAATAAFNKLFDRTDIRNRETQFSPLVKSNSDRRPIPIFIRLAVVSHYRIKGVAL